MSTPFFKIFQIVFTAYTTQQVMPVAQEGIEKMAPTIGSAAKEIAKGIKQGINEANKEQDNELNN